MTRSNRGWGWSTRRRRPGAGYTLLELLLVLAILALLVGSTWSGLQAMQGDRRLREVADQVRHELAACRMRAIETGMVYQFRLQPGGTSFSAVPFESLAEGTATVATVTGQLPEGLVFALPAQASPSGAPSGSTASRGATGSSSATPAASGLAAILFAPDGTAHDAAFEIVDERDRYVRISVRGLTAGIAVGSPQSRSSR